MSTGAWVAIIIVVVIVAAALVIGAMAAARRRRLQRRFGPEYDRVVGERGSQLKAESELAGRERRVQSLNVRPLSDEQLATPSRCAGWTVGDVAGHFVGSLAEISVGEIDGQGTEPVTKRACPVEHAGARLEANIADTDRRAVIGDRTDRSDQGAGIGVDLDERAGA